MAKRSSAQGEYKSIFQKQKKERMNKITKLLNYKGRVEKIKENQMFENKLEDDN